MSFFSTLFTDESAKPSSARVKQFGCFFVAIGFGVAGIFVDKSTQTYLHSLVVAFLLGGGFSGVAGQVKSAIVSKPREEQKEKGKIDAKK